MDTFPGEHDEGGKIGLVSLSFIVGLVFGAIVALFMSHGDLTDAQKLQLLEGELKSKTSEANLWRQLAFVALDHWQDRKQ